MKSPTTQTSHPLQITRKVTVTIEINEIVKILVDALNAKYQRAKGPNGVMDKGTTTSATYTLYRVLSFLPGLSDVDAVKRANKSADDYGYPRIKVAEFRRWLPICLSEVFADLLGKSKVG